MAGRKKKDRKENSTLDLNIWNQLQQLQPASEITKAEATELQIIKAAIQIIYQEGLSNFTYERISQLTGCTRPLVHHYFKTKDDLLKKAVLFVRVHYQNYVVDHMAIGKTANDKLMLYTEYAIRWSVECQDYFSLWLLFFFLTSTTEWAREQNRKYVEIGWERITKLINEIANEQKIDFHNPSELARTIQVYITGGVISLGTEQMSTKEQKNFVKKNIADILQILKMQQK